MHWIIKSSFVLTLGMGMSLVANGDLVPLVAALAEEFDVLLKALPTHRPAMLLQETLEQAWERRVAEVRAKIEADYGKGAEGDKWD